MLSVFLWLKQATLRFLSLRGNLKIAWKLSCRKPVSSFSDTGFSDPPGSPGSTFSPCLTIFNPWEAAKQKVGQLSRTVLKEPPTLLWPDHVPRSLLTLCLRAVVHKRDCASPGELIPTQVAGPTPRMSD